MTNEPNTEINQIKEIITEPATPGRVKIYNLLVPSGITPIPLEKLDYNKLGETKVFHVEKIQGPSWEDLIKNGQTSSSEHIKIAQTVVEQMLTLKEKQGILLGDRQASNIILTSTINVNPLTIKHIDLSNAVDITTKLRLFTENPVIPEAEELLISKEIAHSLRRAIESSSDKKGDLKKLDIFDPISVISPIPKNSERSLAKLNEAISLLS